MYFSELFSIDVMSIVLLLFCLSIFLFTVYIILLENFACKETLGVEADVVGCSSLWSYKVWGKEYTICKLEGENILKSSLHFEASTICVFCTYMYILQD